MRPFYESTLLLVLTSLASGGALAAVLFLFAGRVDLPWFWATLGVFVASHLVMMLVVFRRDPALARERLHPGPGVPTWDKVGGVLGGVVLLATLPIGPLDVGRFGWSDTVPAAVQALGLVGVAGGMGLMTWSMAENTFFSRAVRIQKERDHRVIRSGPYRFVRHPGYVGWIVLWSSFNLALGSWLAVAFSLLVTVVVVIRTAMEDRFLQKGLPGYTEYARQVKWRLVPGIW